MRNNNGLDKTLAAFNRLKTQPREKITAQLVRSGNRIAKTARYFAEPSRSTGKLIDSIVVTEPNQTTPPYSQPSGSRIAGPTEVIITVGNSDVRYAHLVEYGTAKMDAQSFFWPSVRLEAPREQKKINAVGRRAARDSWGGKK